MSAGFEENVEWDIKRFDTKSDNTTKKKKQQFLSER